MKQIWYIWAMACGLWMSALVQAQFEEGAFGGVGGLGGEVSGASTKAQVFTDAKVVEPGKSFTVALKLEHPEGWHSYYKNSGAMELPVEIEWQLPAGFEAGEIRWPVPAVKDGAFEVKPGQYFKSHYYSGSPVFLVEIKVGDGVEVGKSYEIKGKAKWQICKDSCMDESKDIRLTVEAAKQAVWDDGKSKELAEVKAKMPEDGGQGGWKFAAKQVGEKIEIRMKPAKAGMAKPKDFIPDQSYVMAMSGGGAVREEAGEWVMSLPILKKDALDMPLEVGAGVSGIWVGEPSVKMPWVEFGREGVVAKGEGKAVESLSLVKLLPVLGGMFLGGLILNLMPCVFPVIGIKIMGFVQQAGSERKKIVLHGVVFAVGVLASFAVLSTILFFLRETIGWGFQLQNPWVVLVLLVLMLVMALNMYGVFEMGVSATSVGGELQAKSGLAGTFFSGVLATVVATPCSGPFLGTAIGVAYTLPALQYFTAFGAMAMGLSLPYLVLSVFPKLIELLPRPGAWMESFKQGMSFLLFGTVGYLLWVYAGLVELDNMLNPVLGVTVIAMAAWVYGRWSLPYRRQAVRVRAWVLTVVMAGGGLWLLRPVAPSKLVWETWSEAAVEQALKEGKPVYVDFTAKWCATCQLNKKRAYTDEVVALMAKKGVVTFKADKTKDNPAIDAAIKKLGRTAIPVNILVRPGQEPVIFSELLSPNELIQELKR